MSKYSQAKQDKFVLSFFKEGYSGTFVDVGCWMPDEINNTLLLEEHGWYGVSFDITDMSNEWKLRGTPFVCANALTCDFKKLFEENLIPKVVDYLSLDVEGDGDRYNALVNVFKSGYEFKIITIEHDAWRGYNETERKPQREFLNELGYFLLCSNVAGKRVPFNPMEDWWINPKYINKEEHMILLSESLSCDEILEKINL
jgi:hypothetical protein